MNTTFFEQVSFVKRVLDGEGSLAQKFAVLLPIVREDADVAREFLAQLNTADWIDVLAAEGLFLHPPPAEVVARGMRFPSWPASKYLRRVAKADPGRVAKIFESIDTDNSAVIADLVDAALEMPPEHAASLVPVISRSAMLGRLWMAFKDAADVCVLLANGKQIEPALNLAEALFGPRVEASEVEPNRRDDHWYMEGLKDVTPALSVAAPRLYLEQLCRWLNEAIKAKRSIDHSDGEDFSTMWRPAIEEHEQNYDYDLASTLVGCVRIGFETALDGGKLSLGQALEILAEFEFVVYRRLEIHLITRYAEQNEALACSAMLTRQSFDDYRLKHEYALLVGKRLPMLTVANRKTWYGWIDAGPDMSGYDESFQRGTDRSPTDDDRLDRINYWKFERLHWVRLHLEGVYKEFYEQMLKEKGEPELPDLNFRMTHGWGAESPIPVEQFAGRSLREVLDEIQALGRGDLQSKHGASIEGLASVFEQYVALDAASLSKDAQELEGASPVFVRKFINQISDAVKKGNLVHIAAVLALCEWVVRQPVVAILAREHERLVDRDWQWTRDEVSHFIKNVCSPEVGSELRYSEADTRTRMWSLLAELYRDPSTSNIIRDRATEDPRLHDYLDMGINSSRGRAVEAALAYARWRANQIKEMHEGREVVPNGFDAMSEVREMLEWQMRRDNRSVEAMSVIGSRIGLIYWIDRDWLARNASDLFDLDAVDHASTAVEGWAAWNAFLVWVPPHIEYYRTLRSQFAHAVELATRLPTRTEQPRTQPMSHLGEHLMLLYGRGQLGLEEDSAIVRRFIESAQPDLRRHAISFVGRSVSGDRDLPAEVVRRFQTLWDLYWDGPGRADAAKEPQSWLFGQWFVSGRFPESWALNKLREFAEVVGLPEPDHSVVERLARVANTDLVSALAVLKSMIDGDTDGWHVRGWINSARTILETGLRDGGSNRERAIELVNVLGRRGFMAMGELLPS